MVVEPWTMICWNLYVSLTLSLDWVACDSVVECGVNLEYVLQNVEYASCVQIDKWGEECDNLGWFFYDLIIGFYAIVFDFALRMWN